MKTIEIDGKSYLIDIEKATEQGLLKEKDDKPRSWEGYCNNTKRNIYEYCDFSSREENLAFIALGKLIQLRDAWWGDWRPDWNKDAEKFNIYYALNKCHIDVSVNVCYTLSFPTKEMATDFLSTFRYLIEQSKMFL